MTTTVQYNDVSDFTTFYTRLRTLEGRMFDDQQLLKLPEVEPSHRHFKEWQLRKRSSQQLINYLEKKKRALDILEVGCGNGWLSHRLAAIPQSRVIGMDINITEIGQAARVFHFVPNLHFMYGGQLPGVFKENEFDAVVFAASLQYFPSLEEIIPPAKNLLKRGGELHIIDTAFYGRMEILQARQRTQHYYQSLGVPELSDYYFHHALEDIRPYAHFTRYESTTIRGWFRRRNNPFPWICIKSNP